jgi:hypothetical protein
MSVSSNSSNISDISECAICLEEKTGFVAKIDCGHIYHYSCVQSWINKKKNYKKCCCICEKDTEIIQLLGNETLDNETFDNVPLDNLPLIEKKPIYCCNIL